MKTKYVLVASLALFMVMSGTIAWSQGRGHDNGRKGKAKEHGYQKHRDHRGNDGNDYDRRDHYSYNDRDHHHHHGNTRTVYVYRPRPVERTVVVHHHHHHRPERPRYVYYRDYDVYYDCDRNVYITFSGRNWSISTEVPIRMYYTDRNAIAAVNVDYFNDDFPHYLDTHRPGGKVCDHW
jgi:hypothetical protein